jgi:DNA-directed RNA polymerase subunit RPC12/RpoP
VRPDPALSVLVTAQNLAVLHCSGCGAPVALGAGDEAVCRQCGARTPIPGEHRALRDAAGFDAAARRAAEAALHRLDRPPGPGLRALAAVARIPFWVIFLVFGAPLFFVTLPTAFRLAHRIAAAAGWPTGDDLSSALIVGLMGAQFYLMAIVPSFLLIYGGRRVTARARLVAALAAKPPTTPGGPASCRACGAPLERAADEHVARCLYCRAENALIAPEAHLKAARGVVARIATTVAGAVAQDVEERRATRRKLGRGLWTVTWKTGVAVGLWTYAQYGIDQERFGGETPGSAVAAIVVLTFFIIYLIMASLAGSSDPDRDG